MPESYRVTRNKWGGFYVVDSLGNLAPSPHGFNNRVDAQDRADALNRAEGAAAAERAMAASPSHLPEDPS